MSDRKLFLDSRFMRSYLFATAWVALGAGILFLVANVLVLGIFLSLLGVISLGIGISRRSLNVDYYPRNRVITLGLTSVLFLLTAISVRVLMPPPREVYWVIYLIVTICLWLYTWLAFILSVKDQMDEEYSPTKDS
jgi:hypothetical protein